MCEHTVKTRDRDVVNWVIKRARKEGGYKYGDQIDKTLRADGLYTDINAKSLESIWDTYRYYNGNQVKAQRVARRVKPRTLSDLTGTTVYENKVFGMIIAPDIDYSSLTPIDPYEPIYKMRTLLKDRRAKSVVDTLAKITGRSRHDIGFGVIEHCKNFDGFFVRMQRRSTRDVNYEVDIAAPKSFYNSQFVDLDPSIFPVQLISESTEDGVKVRYFKVIPKGVLLSGVRITYEQLVDRFFIEDVETGIKASSKTLERAKKSLNDKILKAMQTAMTSSEGW
jgi:hypothetical protein